MHTENIHQYMRQKERKRNYLTESNLHKELDSMFNLYDVNADQKLSQKEIRRMLDKIHKKNNSNRKATEE